MTTHHGWLGRVFGSGDAGGNHTAIVGQGFDMARAPALAKRLGVPDTGFLTELSDRRVTLRTFSPYEELEQCFQTSLAVLSALNVPEGETWEVSHAEGDRLEVVREPEMTWAVPSLAGRPRLEPVPVPANIKGKGRAAVLRQARSRLHVRLEDLAHVNAVDLTPGQVLDLCAEHQAAGVVISGPVEDRSIRVRVFTSSLGGAEDSATGGAVIGVGILESVDGVRGDVVATQGPEDAARQGRLGLRISGPYEVGLGGASRTIMEGEFRVGGAR
ncbi:PhzF family phenazine biosynthesis protein [Actinomadura chibensis]|nr:PhzF family phenazine biosynthesis protein [Actinomadura chibensis]